jgi:hypothetical protein
MKPRFAFIIFIFVFIFLQMGFLFQFMNNVSMTKTIIDVQGVIAFCWGALCFQIYFVVKTLVEWIG